ncbi:MAG: dihydroneopterin aldolase [Thermodesulfobacteriota bacterium]
MIIRIKGLRLRAIVGLNDWERENRQDLVINAGMEMGSEDAVGSDDIADSVNYRTITKRIVSEVEGSSFFLIEALAGAVLDILMEDERVRGATVEVEKPGALRFADSVSVELARQR